jgi:hypothetical protein
MLCPGKPASVLKLRGIACDFGGVFLEERLFAGELLGGSLVLVPR